YDKNELLIPEFINEKGHRFYSETQYHTLEIILNLRKLDIPVQDIKNYLLKRDFANLQEILREKEKDCDKTIQAMTEMKNSLRLSLENLKKSRDIAIGQVELTRKKEALFLGSEILTGNVSPKERLRIFSRHSQDAFDKNHFKEFSTGWIIEKNEFFAGKFNKTMQYFTPVANLAESGFSLVRPAGLYVTICFQGTFYQEISNVFKIIREFMDRNFLAAVDNVYVFPLKNHWITENTKEYINEVSFQVETRQ
ncbi:MAG: MerR family transcriptional regulator, partial [Sporomusaceae bacterium]|nr:MerR family transcriptional regulator [Sporomusaceae bacterium]